MATENGAPPVRGEQETADAEKWLRMEWWADHGDSPFQLDTPHCPYGDDGEMQCCGIDFKRMKIDDLQRRVMEGRERRTIRLLSAPVRAEAAKTEPTPDDASLRTVVAHPFFALAREFNWDDNQLTAARQLIDITVIRLEEMQAAQQAEIADMRNQNEIHEKRRLFLRWNGVRTGSDSGGR